MGRKKRGRAAKQARKKAAGNQEELSEKTPHSFVFHRGHVGKNIQVLEMDMRKLMEPYTARHLQVRKKNVLKDFISVAGFLNVSHFVIFTKTEISTNMKIARVPKGPTLTFKVHSYCLAKDIISSIKRHSMNPKIFNHHSLLVMNNFSGEGLHLKLMSTMFQNMFPSISINQVKLDHIKRCVVLNYDPKTKQVEMRHYMIIIKPVGMSRPAKKLIKSKIPDLGKFEDVSEYMMQGNLSESEGELDGPHNQVTLPQPLSSRGNIKSTQSAVRLLEVGPRLALQLVKIEEGLCEGDIMFHEFIQKTPEELAKLKSLREKKSKIKALRKKQQADNVKKKEEHKENHKSRSLAGMKKTESGKDKDSQNTGSESEEESDVDDDADYYRQEVGQEPDEDLFPKRGVKRRHKVVPQKSTKRRRSDAPKNDCDHSKGKRKFSEKDRKLPRTTKKFKTRK